MVLCKINNFALFIILNSLENTMEFIKMNILFHKNILYGIPLFETILNAISLKKYNK